MDVSVPTIPTTPCQFFTDGQLLKDGYRQVTRNGGTVLAHRWTYTQQHGQIPPGLDLDHLCSVRDCVAVDHLEPVTPKENTRRSVARRYATGVMACGHCFTVERPSERLCVDCRRVARTKSRRRNREWNARVAEAKRRLQKRQRRAFHPERHPRVAGRFVSKADAE